MGASVRFSPDRWTISPAARSKTSPISIDCGESGTTLRFVATLAARSARSTRLVGRGRLPQRPSAPLFAALESLGASCRRPRGDRELPTTVRGPLHGGRIRLDSSVSSQFTSSLLLTLPTVPGDSTVDLVGPIVSAPYIEATLAVLRHHRIRIGRRGRRFTIPGDQTYRGHRAIVPGDASSAAYLWTAAAITGGTVRVTGVPTRWPQADLAILDVLTAAGARVRRTTLGATVAAGPLRGFTADLTSAPDLYPLVGVLAASIPARSRIEGAEHVVHKESDRRIGTQRLARAMGAKVTFRGDGLSVVGTDRPTHFHWRGVGDHRIVMSAAVGAFAADGVSTVEHAEAVAKSFPGFWDAVSSLGGCVNP